MNPGKTVTSIRIQRSFDTATAEISYVFTCGLAAEFVECIQIASGCDCLVCRTWATKTKARVKSSIDIGGVKETRFTTEPV